MYVSKLSFFLAKRLRSMSTHEVLLFLIFQNLINPNRNFEAPFEILLGFFLFSMLFSLYKTII